MADAELLAFTALALVLTVTPGADTMVLFRNVLRGGRAQGVATALGGRTSLVFHACLSALGVSAVLAHSAAAYRTLQIVGAAYLTFLGLKSLWRACRGDLSGRRLPSGSRPAGAADGSAERSHGWRRSYGEGFLTNALNPKTAVFYLAFLPQFVRPQDPVLLRSLLLCGIHVLISLGWYLTLCLLFHQARQFLSRGAVRRWLDAGSGAVLVALGVKLALEKAR